MKKSLFSLWIMLFLFPGIVSAEENAVSGSGSWVSPEIVSASEAVEVQTALALDTDAPVSNLEDLSALIYENMKNYKTNFDISYTGDSSNLKAEIRAIFTEFEQLDDYLSGTLSAWNFKYGGYENNVKIQIQIEYLTNTEQELFVDEQVVKIATELSKPGMSDVEKVRAVNEYIVLNTEYSFDTIASPHAAYAILTEGKGVCQAYALLAYRLLDEMGMGVQYVVGYVGDIGHAWNLVKVDGEWYQLDTTWNDPVPNRDGVVGYNYFLVSDRVLEKDHEWINSDYVTATSEKYSFLEDVNYVTFVNDYLIYSSRSDDNNLYRFNLTTDEFVKLSDARALYPVASGEWVYFSNYKNGGYLTKVKIDGTSETVINKRLSTNLKIEGNILTYETSDGTLESIIIEASPEPISIDTKVYDIWDEKPTKDVKKEWIISFSTDLDERSVTANNLYIIDAYGNKITAATPILLNSKQIRIKMNGEFSKEKTYYVVIENKVKSIDGQNLKKGIYMPFKVQ